MTDLEKVTAQRNDLREVIERYIDLAENCYGQMGVDLDGSSKGNQWIAMYQQMKRVLKKTDAA